MGQAHPCAVKQRLRAWLERVLGQVAGSTPGHLVPGARSEGRRISFLKNAGPGGPGLADPHYEVSFEAQLCGGA